MSPLLAFDAVKHHVGLGAIGGTLFGFTLQGAYRKELQPGPNGGGREFGGQNDLAEPVAHLARWTQDDFIGGSYQETWGLDPAMFSRSRNVIPNPQARSVITVPPLFQAKVFDPSTKPGAPAQPVVPKAMFNVAGSIYVVFKHGILRYVIATGLTFWSTGPGVIDGGTMTWGSGIGDAAYLQDEGVIYVLVSRAGTDAAQLHRIKTDLTVATFQPVYTAPDRSWRGQGAARGINVRGTGRAGSIVAALGQHLYSIVTPERKDGEASAVWTHIGRLPGIWVASLNYAGLTYILCNEADGETHLVAFDGTAILPVVSFPFNFQGASLFSYGGRIFVGGSGTDVAGNHKYAELHEVTGASVRLVRTFNAAERNGAAVPKVIRDMAVSDGLLWFFQQGVKMIAYDLSGDAFFGASQTQLPLTADAYKFARARGSLYGWFHDTALPGTLDGLYRVAVAGDVVSAYDGEVESSDFNFEPSLDKRWSQLRVLTRNGSVGLDYSVDGGATWTNIPLGANEQTMGSYRLGTFDLASIAASKQIRFRLYLPRGVDVVGYTELVAFTCTFDLLPSGKKTWALTVNGSAQIEARDGTALDRDVEETRRQLWEWVRLRTPLEFKDLDDETYKVTLRLSEHLPIVGPDVVSEPEAFYGLTLVEV